MRHALREVLGVVRSKDKGLGRADNALSGRAV